MNDLDPSASSLTERDIKISLNIDFKKEKKKQKKDGQAER